MKCILLVVFIIGMWCKGFSQGTPEYQYAVLQIDDGTWKIYYEDTVQYLNIRLDGEYNQKFYAQVFKLFHSMNEQGYELINFDQPNHFYVKYYFRRSKRK